MYTLFRGEKMCKVEENGVFLVMFTNFGKGMMEKFFLKVFGVYFHT